MRYLFIGIMIGLVIQYVLNIVFLEVEGVRFLRENVLRVIMIVIDGRLQDLVVEVVVKVRDIGILIFVIGVGQVDFNILKVIGSEFYEDYVFLVVNFSQMELLILVFQNKLCSKFCFFVVLLGELLGFIYLFFSVYFVLFYFRNYIGKGCLVKVKIDMVFF